MHIHSATVTRSLAAAALALCAQAALAQSFPGKPIRMIIPFAAGGGVDTTARLLGGKMGESMGQQILMENRAGAGGNIATEAVAKAAPDGYTLLITTNGHTIQPSLTKVSWDPIRDFAPISLVVVYSNVLVVHPAVPAKSVKELIAHAKANPGKLNYGSTGSGGPQNLAVELFKSMAGLNILHVPYKGNAPMTTALLAGDIHMVMDTLTSPLSHIKAGKLRALAVTGRRSQVFPDLPSIAEAGLPGFEYEGLTGILAPAGTPAAVIERLHAEVVKGMALPEVRNRLVSLGYEPVAGTPAQFATRISADVVKFAKIIKDANIKAEE
jgi:tripartite-type tricarboxylate transporter receptor subunit TctC